MRGQVRTQGEGEADLEVHYSDITVVVATRDKVVRFAAVFVTSKFSGTTCLCPFSNDLYVLYQGPCSGIVSHCSLETEGGSRGTGGHRLDVRSISDSE